MWLMMKNWTFDNCVDTAKHQAIAITQEKYKWANQIIWPGVPQQQVETKIYSCFLPLACSRSLIPLLLFTSILDPDLRSSSRRSIEVALALCTLLLVATVGYTAITGCIQCWVNDRVEAQQIRGKTGGQDVRKISSCFTKMTDSCCW